MLVRRFYITAIITPLNVEAKKSIRGLAPSGLGWYNPRVRVAAASGQANQPTRGYTKAMTESSKRRDAVREAEPRLEAPPGGSPLKFAPEPTGETGSY
jgi:hypothetical protein